MGLLSFFMSSSPDPTPNEEPAPAAISPTLADNLNTAGFPDTAHKDITEKADRSGSFLAQTCVDWFSRQSEAKKEDKTAFETCKRELRTI